MSAFSILNTNISQVDFDNLLEVFAWFTAEGWQIPAWLQEWGLHWVILRR